MSSSKRDRSSDELGRDARQTKASKRAAEDGQTADVEQLTTPEPSTQVSNQAIQIIISLRSTSKASENDPKPDSYWRDLLHADLEALMREQRPASNTTNSDPSQSRPNAAREAHAHDDSEPDNSFDDDDGDFDDSDSDRSSMDEFAEFMWLEQIDGRAIEAKTQIAICDAKLIRRDQIRLNFWEDMEEPTTETSQLAFQLFDRYGRLNRKYYEHDFKRGTGVWGPELDNGDILLFEVLSVKADKRRAGVGTKIVQGILDKVRSKTEGFIALAQPGFLHSEIRDGDEVTASQHMAATLQFWRSLGFRRVGTSGWFAFVDDPEHPSRQLSISQDWEKPPSLEHYSAVSNAFKEAVAILARSGQSEEQYLLQIQGLLPDDPQDTCWSSTDESGNTLLHHAAIKSRSDVVEFIFSQHPGLASMRNREGDTPLEALQDRLESIRSKSGGFGSMGFTQVMSDKFKGFPQCSITCISILSGTEVFDLDKLSPEDIRAVSDAKKEPAHLIKDVNAIRHALRLKYGCTCGECIGGFFSPRMKFALLCQAEVQYDMMQEEMDYVDGPDWVFFHSSALRSLPASVQQNMKTNKSMRKGFIGICSHIAECLRENEIPNTENILLAHQRSNEWPPVTANYLQRGGTVAAVAIMLFNLVLIESKCVGNGEHEVIFADEIRQHPKCRNDDEFKFVAGMCGYRGL